MKAFTIQLKDVKKRMNLNRMIGNCTEEDVVDDIFGSVSEFARQVEENGDEFLYQKGVVVKYDEDNDIHYFYQP